MVFSRMNLAAITTITRESTKLSSDIDQKFIELRRKLSFIVEALYDPKWSNSAKLSASQEEIETLLFM